MNSRAFALLAGLLLAAAPAAAHPAPFSYLDLHLRPGAIDVSLVAHVFDIAHDLPVADQERLLDPAFLAGHDAAIAALLGGRLRLTADGRLLPLTGWSPAEPLPERQAIRLRTRLPLDEPAGIVTIDARLFPYDPAHQTFVNVNEGEVLAVQAILDTTKPALEYFAGSREGALAVVRRFMPVGFRHVIFGADHLVFLGGLLLLGGTSRRIGGLLGALAGGNGVAWLLTWLNLLDPPARIVEPALALGIVYLGADNLLVRGGRDLRAGIAFGFGLIHGFWFATGLRSMDLPAATVGWSLMAFDAGAEAGHLVVVLALGFVIRHLRAQLPALAGRATAAASVGVMAAGTYWFVQRLFFPAGLI